RGAGQAAHRRSSLRWFPRRRRRQRGRRRRRPLVNPAIDPAARPGKLRASPAAASRPLLIFDASWYLPGDARSARGLYREAHLPGAGFFDVDAIADVDSPLPHMVPSVSRFERLVGELGIANDTRVLFYDQQGVYSAPRAWWLLRLFGHAECAVLDGGLPEWRRRGLSFEAGEPIARAPR